MEENEQTIVNFYPPKLYFPSDVLKWIKLNANPKMALKLMKVCKYFQHSNGFPFLVVKYVRKAFSKWFLVMLDNTKISHENLDTIPKKLWVTGEVFILPDPNAVSTLLNKTVVCNIQRLILYRQDITMDEFKALTDGETVEEFETTQSTITYENTEIVPFEDICECLPSARIVNLGLNAPSIHSLKAAEEKISSKLGKLTLLVDTKNFNVETLLAYMKNHQKIHYTIWFCGISKAEFDHSIAPLVNELLQNWSPENNVPEIHHRDENNPTVCCCPGPPLQNGQ